MNIREIQQQIIGTKNTLTKNKGYLEELQHLDTVECMYTLGQDWICESALSIKINAPKEAVVKALQAEISGLYIRLARLVDQQQEWLDSE